MISGQVDVANMQKPLFISAEGEEGDMEADEEVEIPFPNLMEIMSYFEQGGIGLGKDETYRIFLALKQLTKDHPLSSVRFWGKIYGIEANYIIAEAEYQEGQGEEDEEEEEQEQKQEEEEAEEKEDEEGEEKDELPRSQWKPPPVIPKEEPKSGTNKKTYFVCNNAGDKWHKLPNVKPAEVVACRQIRKLMTGRLDAPLVSYPPFPGSEENFLRAQICRISGTTHISPSGYYQFEEDEEEPEDGEGPGPIEVNKEFEVGKISEFADGSMNNWVHHVSYVLPQGRCKWFDPVQRADDEFEEEDEDDEEKEQLDEPQPESGPQILTSVAEDAAVDGMPAWSARLSSNIIPQYAIASVSSNLWPGAHAYVTGKNTFENIYIGWGLKYSSVAFNPLLPPTVQEEFPIGADVIETTDPTVEQEAALKSKLEEADIAAEEEEEPEDSDDEG
jgi:radial spoke head protein 4A